MAARRNPPSRSVQSNVRHTPVAVPAVILPVTAEPYVVTPESLTKTIPQATFPTVPVIELNQP